MSRRKRWNRGKRWTRPRRRPRGVLDDPGRDEQRRWRRQACEVLAGSLEASPRDSAEPGNAGCAKRRRLLISLAAFLEPGHRRRLGAEGAWGVYRADVRLQECEDSGKLRPRSCPLGCSYCEPPGFTQLTAGGESQPPARPSTWWLQLKGVCLWHRVIDSEHGFQRW